MTQALMTPAPETVAPERVRQTFALRDLDVAPENMRFDEPADDEVPQLAATIKAAGVLQPLTVRPGRRKEKPAMALDGRRRLMALALLRAAGEIGDDYPVETFVETDPARQAAALLLTNTAAPVHVADVIASIGKMLKSKLSVPVISAALGYGEIEVKRLAALAGLHPKALQALKAGKLNLRQAKLLARLPNRDAQAEVAEASLQGFGFPEHRVTEALDEGRVTLNDRRLVLVGAARYAAAGGRIEADLFGERADVLLDPEILEAAWCERASGLAARLARDDLQVHVSATPDPDWPEGLEGLGYGYGAGLDAGQLTAWRAARAEAATVAEQAAAADPALETAEAAVLAYCEARLAADRASEPGRTVTAVILTPASGAGIELHSFAPEDIEPEAAEDGEPTERDDGTEADEPALRPGPPAIVPVAAAAAPEVDGVNHALHEVRTDTATRVLIRALADDPATALIALVARLFDVEALRHGVSRGDGASTIAAEAYGRPRFRVIETLDGEVRRRLADRRVVWEASGRSTLGWVAGLEETDRLALLAELVALSLDLREERTTSLRRRARTEAAELAALCGAEVTEHWTPDAVFLRAHSKPQLMAMLTAMAADEDRARTLKKDELVDLVVEQAAGHRWAPAYLSWRAELPEAETEASVADDETEPPAAADTLAA